MREAHLPESWWKETQRGISSRNFHLGYETLRPSVRVKVTSDPTFTDLSEGRQQMKHHSCISVYSSILSQYETVIRIITSQHQATAKLCSERSVSPANASWTFRKTRSGEKPDVFHHIVNVKSDVTWFCWRLNLSTASPSATKLLKRKYNNNNNFDLLKQEFTVYSLKLS